MKVRSYRSILKPILWVVLVLLVALVGLGGWITLRQPSWFELLLPDAKITISTDDRILILAPHPDDETLATGGIIQRAVELHIPIHVVYLTNGDSNVWSFAVYRKRPVLDSSSVRSMGMLRSNEAIAAAQELGLGPGQLTFLGYPDSGTLSIWMSHWDNLTPFRSMLTRATAVPYANAFRPGAPYKGEEILQDLKTIIIEFRPTKIFLPHPADHNPDHQALYLFTRVALWDLAEEMQVDLFPYLIHLPNWPMLRGYHPDLTLSPPPFPARLIEWKSFSLTDEEVSRKLLALKAHSTQYQSNMRYLLSFVRRNELFGDVLDIPLKSLDDDVTLSFIGQFPPDPPDVLTESEKRAYVGLEWREVAVKEDLLILTLQFSQDLQWGVQASVYAFGYRTQQPFGTMPKIHVKITVRGLTLFDQSHRLECERFTFEQHDRELTIRLPLHLIGDPEHVVIGARTYLLEVPLDWVAWRVVELPMDL